MSQNPPPSDPWGNNPDDQSGQSGSSGGQQPGWGQQPGYGQQPPYGQQPGYGAPQYGYGPPMGSPPDNYLVWAILSTVLCCLPLGIVSIVYSSQVNSKWAMGDTAGAHESARKAKSWAIWSVVGFFVGILLYFGLFAAVLGISLGSGSGY